MQTPELKAYVEKLHKRRSELLSELSAIDLKLRHAAHSDAVCRRIFQCDCGKEFVSENDFQIHRSLPKNSDHQMFGERVELATPNSRPINLNFDRKFKCCCGVEFVTFIERLIHIDSSPSSERGLHGDAGEFHNGKLVHRNTTVKGDPVTSTTSKRTKALDSFDNIVG